jgi:magnesium transporter
MQKVIFEDSATGFRWIDFSNPTREDLIEASVSYGLHPTSVHDCLDPHHLPKFERIGDVCFLIIRSYDETCNAEADSVRDLTRKVALFAGKDFLLTIHRKEQPFLERIKAEWLQPADRAALTAPEGLIVAQILRASLACYEAPLVTLQNHLEVFEEGVFAVNRAKASLKDGFLIKRKASVFRRMLRLLSEVIPKLDLVPGGSPPVVQDLRETAEKLIFQSDDIIDSITGLVSLYLSISTKKMEEASFRTNEVMRVLTVFSVFFLPLNFIAGVYGMNFHHMPELETRHGYFVVLGVMALVCLSIFWWFRRKGWTSSRELT